MNLAKNKLKGCGIGTICEVIQVSRSTYYRIRKERDREEIAVEQTVINCFKRYQGNYGRRRIRQVLIREEIWISECKIARILRENGLEAKSGRTGRSKAPKATEMQYFEANLIAEKFSVHTPNALWCSDITILVCEECKVYVCGVIDVATRRLVGWAIRRHQRQEIVHAAFLMAVGRNPDRPENAIFHSDRGAQYTSRQTKELVERYGFRKSMSRPGTPSDNQPIESFWRTLECEMPDIRHLTFEETEKVLVQFFEMYYNSNRLHSSRGYVSPNEFLDKLTV